MFLLIRDPKEEVQKMLQSFTFHNVSINTDELEEIDPNLALFTFHNVSINTEKTMIAVEDVTDLYIPQCFY